MMQKLEKLEATKNPEKAGKGTSAWLKVNNKKKLYDWHWLRKMQILRVATTKSLRFSIAIWATSL